MRALRRGLLLLLIIMSVTTVYHANAEDDYIYRGRIRDEEGNPVPSVRILVYDLFKVQDPQGETGYYVKTVKSIKDGSYSIPLYLGSFKLVYERDGYITQTRTIMFATTQDVNLGTLVMKRTIELSLQGANRTAYPGMRLKVPFQMANVGDREESLRIDAACAAEWETRILDEVGQFSALSIQPGSLAHLSLEVEVPLEATGDTEITLTARGNVELRKVLAVTVLDEIPRLLSCPFPSKLVKRGEEVEFGITLCNPFYFGYRFNFDVKGLSPEYAPVIMNEDGESISSTYIESGSAQGIIVRVDVPASGLVESFNFTLATDCQGYGDELSLAVEVPRSSGVIHMKTPYPSMIIRQGAEATYHLSLENPGDSDEVLELSTVNLPRDWQAYFYNAEGLMIQSIRLEAKAKENIRAVVKPSLGSELGTYTMNLTAKSTSFRGDLEVSLTLMGSTKIDMKLPALYEQLSVGDEKQIAVEVVNTGYSPVSSLEVRATSSLELIQVEVEPLRVMVLNPLETQEFLVTVRALEGTASGDYILELKAVSREAETETSQIRITVSPSGSQFIIVGAVVVAAFASIALVYKKFKRR